MRAYHGGASCGGSLGAAAMNFWVNGLALPDFAASYVRTLVPWVLTAGGMIIAKLIR